MSEKPQKSRYNKMECEFNEREAEFVANKLLSCGTPEARAELAKELHKAWVSGAESAYIWIKSQGTINIGRDWHDGDYLCHVYPFEIENRIRDLACNG